MSQTPGYRATTRWRSWENKRAATGRRVRRGSHRAASGPVAGGVPGGRIPLQAARPEDGFDWGYAAVTWRTIEIPCLRFCGKLDANSAVADEAAGLVEHRLPAYLE